MSNTNIQTIEGTEYKVTLNVSGVANLTDYRVEGSCKAIGSCTHGIKPFRVAEVTDSSVIMFIPTLASGSYQYQVFITRISTNQEFLVLEGRIDVSNKIKANEDTTIAPTGTVADVVLNAETVEVTVAITEGTAGKDGEKGERGEKGEAFTFDDFTPEQLASLKGEKGERGEKGEKGDPGEGGSIDFIVTNPNDSYQGTPTITPNADGSTDNNLLIGNGITVSGSGNTVLGLKASVVKSQYDNSTEGDSVAVGLMATASGSKSVAIGRGARTGASRSVAVGATARVGEFSSWSIAIGQDSNVYNACGITIGNESTNNGYGVTIGYQAWTSSNAVAIGYNARSDNDGLAIGSYAQADTGNITLKSGNVVVKFTPEGMTLNGEPYGQGGSGGSSGGGTDYAQQMLYKVKYAHADLYEVRSSQSSEWREYYDENGNSEGYDHYPYYDDITAKGEWYYDLKTKTNNFTWSYDPTNFVWSQFQYCPLLKKFAAKIGNDITTTNVNNLFDSCNCLEEVIIDCTWLETVNSLFNNCCKVRTFYADLSHLVSASYMFGSDSYNCTSLNVESVEHIANSINPNGNGEIYIGMSRELLNDYGDGIYQRCQDALQKIRNKGWAVYEIYSNNY